jgi:PAS domain S-box-containing protein
MLGEKLGVWGLARGPLRFGLTTPSSTVAVRILAWQFFGFRSRNGKKGIVCGMKTYLVAPSPEWELRLRTAFANRGRPPIVMRHFDHVAEIVHGNDLAIAVLDADGAADEVLAFARRLRDRRPTSKLKIMACVPTPPDNENWPRFQQAGVDFLLPADFSESELEFRLAVAECLLVSDSPDGDAAPAVGDDLDFSPDTENVPYGVFLSTLGNRFIKVNDGLVNLLGYSSKEELLQVDIARDIYVTPGERARLIASIPPHNKTLDVVWKRRDGTRVDLQLSGHWVLDEARRVIYLQGIAWDLTEQKRSAELLRMQRDLGVALSRVSSLREALDIVLDAAMQIEGIDCGGFYLLEKEQQHFRLATFRGLTESGAQAVALVPGDLPAIQRSRDGSPFYFATDESDPILRNWAMSEGIVGHAILPILHESELIGSLVLSSHTRKDFSPATRLAVESIAAYLGGSIARVQAEESLAASQVNLQTLFDAMDDLVLVVDAQGKILHHNSAVEKRLGYSRQELAGMHITELHPPDRKVEVLDVRARLDHQSQAVTDIPLVTKAGDLFPAETRVVHGVWADQEVGFGVARDVSERESSRKALEQSEARFRAIFENASVGIGLSDLTGRMIDVNDAVARMEELTRDEIVGRHFLEFTTPEDGEKQIQLLHQIVEGKIQAFEIEKRYFRKDGTPFWVRNSTSLVPATPGETPKYVVSVIENVDARKRAEESLRESERRYRLIAENVDDVVWSAQWTPPDLAGGAPMARESPSFLASALAGWRFEYISPSVERLFGFTVEECMRETPEYRRVPELFPATALGVLRDLAAHRPGELFRRTFELPLFAKDGSQKWCEITVTILPTEPDEPLRLLGILRDITERHDAEEALQKSEFQFRTLFENLPDVVEIIDYDGKIHFVNHGSDELTTETLRGGDILSFVTEPTEEHCRAQFEKAVATNTVQTIDVRTVTGRYWHCRLVPMTGRGLMNRAMVICTETTAEKMAAEAIRKEQALLQQMIDLQERERRYLSYEIHDGFAQQITGALFHLETFMRLRESDAALAEKNLAQSAAMLRRSIDETRRLISGLRPPILDEAGILAALEYLVCENRERSGIDIMFRNNLKASRLAPPLESAVFRIVQESLANACRHSGGDFIRVELCQEENWLRVAVFDEGVGFDPANVPNDRFGLRSIRERARLLGGKAEIRSTPGDGCLVSVELPLVLKAGE